MLRDIVAVQYYYLIKDRHPLLSFTHIEACTAVDEIINLSQSEGDRADLFCIGAWHEVHSQSKVWT